MAAAGLPTLAAPCFARAADDADPVWSTEDLAFGVPGVHTVARRGIRIGAIPRR